MKTTKKFDPLAERYDFDWALCNNTLRYAQIDTRQDASYYGTWCSPKNLTIIYFTEGEITIDKADTAEEFITALREFAKWNEEAGYGRINIDPGPYSDTAKAFVTLGVEDLLHKTYRPPAIKSPTDHTVQ